MTWQLQDAKNKLSEVVQSSIDKGPQIISRYGKETAVVVSFADYQKWTAPKKSLKEFLKSGPRLDLLDLSYDDPTSTGRGTEFTL